MILQPLLLLLLIAPAAPAPASSSPAPATEEMKLVDDLFGKQITEALATPDVQDNIQVAGDMLKAAEDGANPPSLRQALVQQILRVLGNVLTPEASRIIHAGLLLKQKLQPVDSLQEVQAQLDIFTKRYSLTRQVNADPDIRQQAAHEVVSLSQQLAKLQAEGGKYDAAMATLTSARQTARAAKLAQEDLQIDETLQQLSAQKARATRLAVLQQKAASAKQAGDAEQIRAAQVQLGLFYLLAEGDLRKAAAELAGTNHAYELPLNAIVAFLDNPKSPPPPDVCNRIAESVADMAKLAESPKVQAVIATAGQQLCQATIAQNPQGLASAKTKLLLMQLEKLTTESPADKLIRILKANYGSFEGKLEKSATGPTVTITYDFTSSKQLGDWEIRTGRWEVNSTRVALGATPVGNSLARLDSRLRFRGDQPVTLSFQASGKQDLDAIFSFRQNGQHDVDFWFANRGQQSVIRVDSRLQAPIKERFDPNQTYRITIAWDGQGNFTWSVNGKEIARTAVQPAFAQMPLAISLMTLQQPVLFKEVKIDGVVIENPNAPASQPASAPAPAPAGQSPAGS